MKAVVQRVIDASVTVNGALKGGVASGLLVYLGVARDDTTQDADWLIEKIPNLRIFDDNEGKMNLSLIDCMRGVQSTPRQIPYLNNNRQVVDCIVNQQKDEVYTTGVNHEKRVVNINNNKGVLAVSQFTLLGDARKGRRPTWDKAAPPEKARELYQYFIEKMREKVPCESGEFQAHMKVTYTNDGPVTVLLDSRDI